MTYKLLTSNDKQFGSLGNGFNQRWTAPNLKAVYVCHSGQDVADALNDAQKNPLIRARQGDVRMVKSVKCWIIFLDAAPLRWF